MARALFSQIGDEQLSHGEDTIGHAFDLFEPVPRTKRAFKANEMNPRVVLQTIELSDQAWLGPWPRFVRHFEAGSNTCVEW